MWEGYGDFQHTNVHKQVAISFRTPRYRSIDVEQIVKVKEIRLSILSTVPLTYLFSFYIVFRSTEAAI